MDIFITFFRDVLDGPLYVVIAIVCGILICSCIGYLGERYLKNQEAKKEYEKTHAAIAHDTVDASAFSMQTSSQPQGVTSLEQNLVAPVGEISDAISRGQGQ